MGTAKMLGGCGEREKVFTITEERNWVTKR